jgi:pyruvate formate lyase activating enzyme
MRIGGFQKTTLTDFPGKIASIVFTIGCPFRCGFCHNPELVLPPFAQAIEQSEIFSYLKRRIGLLQGVVITGGEPTVHSDLLAFIQEIKALGFAVKLDTCGYLPERLEPILCSGFIDYVAMDIKAPFLKYSRVVGVEVEEEKIQRSINLILHSGISHEFRSTIVKGIHSSEDIIEMARMIQGADAYYLPKFRQSQKLVDSKFFLRQALSDSILTQLREQCLSYVKKCDVR